MTRTRRARLAGKVARLRIFENAEGKFDRSLLDTGGAALVVSQFTLIADSKRQKGTRPDFSQGGAAGRQAEPLYEAFCQALRDLGVHVETGVFGARMAGRARQRRPRHDHPRHRLVSRGLSRTEADLLREVVSRRSPTSLPLLDALAERRLSDDERKALRHIVLDDFVSAGSGRTTSPALTVIRWNASSTLS